MGVLAKNRFYHRGLWQNPDFLKLWSGQTISELGSRITRDGLPLLAVLTLGATPFEMGILSAASSVPVLLLSLFAGVWIDRLRRRPVLILADFARALLLLTIPLAAWLGMLAIWQLYVIAALVGTFTLFFDIAYQAYLPSLVERAHLLEGNSKLALSSSVAELAGPGLAGFLIQALTAPVAILIDSLSFLVSVGTLIVIRKPEPPPTPVEEVRPVAQELKEGLRVVLSNPLLRALALSDGVRSFFGNFIGVLYSLYAIRVLGLGPAALGLTIAMGGVGDLLGAFLAQPAVRRFGLGPTLIGSLLLNMFTTLLIPLAGSLVGGPMAAILAVMFAGQLFGDGLRSIYYINEVSLRQAITPDRLLGRVNGSIRLLVAGIGPLGAIVGGYLGTVLGPRNTLFIAAFGALPALAVLLLSPVPKLKEHPDHEIV